MKMKKMNKIITVFIAITMFIASASYPLQAADALIITDDEIIASSHNSRAIYNSKISVAYTDFVNDNVGIDEGLTIIYGSNIDSSLINKINSSNGTAINMESNDIARLASNNNDNNSISNTYIVMCLKNGERIDYQYVSVEFDSNVDVRVIEKFIEAELRDSTIESYAKSFFSNQITTQSSAYNVSSRSSYENRVVEHAIDTNYYICDYSDHTGRYPVVVYKKNVTYDAIIVVNTYPNEDLYFIIANTDVKSGRALTSDEISSINVSGLYNYEYGDKIVMRGIRTIFENLNPNSDRYYQMSPSSGGEDINGNTITINLGYDPAFFNSFKVNANTYSKVNLSTQFSNNGQCRVQFEGVSDGFWGAMGQIDCLSLTSFSYLCGVYMLSGDLTLNTSVATDVWFYFMPTPSSSAIWAGSARQLTYDNS